MRYNVFLKFIVSITVKIIKLISKIDLDDVDVIVV